MRSTLIALLACLATAPVLATEGLGCAGPRDVHIEVPLGGGPGLAPLGTRIAVGPREWTTTTPTPHTPIAVAQAFADDCRIMVDYADADYRAIIIKLRLVLQTGADDTVATGTLWIADVGTFEVSCS